MRKLVAILVVSATFAACGGSSANSDDAIALADAPAQLAKAYCQAEQACSPFYFSIGFANTDCVASLTKQFAQATFDQIQTAIDAKTVSYDGNLARQCANAIASGSCANLNNDTPDSCQKAFTGSVATGGDCSIDQECAGLARCVFTGDTCPGKCAARASAGVACTKDGDCALGLACSSATSHCVAPSQDAEDCGGGVAADCAAGLLCVGDDASSNKAGKCMTEAEALTGKENDVCDLQAGPLCEAGLSCIIDSATAAKGTVYTCHAAAKAGGACGLGLPAQCPSGQTCPLALTDIAAGTYTANCESLPGEGQDCGSALSFARCAANLVCDDTTTPLAPVCITPHDLGESCSGDAVCYSQHCVNKTCVPESACAM
jgi:hypothetical protein